MPSAMCQDLAIVRNFRNAVGIGSIIVVVACARNPDTLRNESASQKSAATCQASVAELTGYLNVIFGDPPKGVGAPTIVFELVTAPGRAVVLSADSASTALDGAARLSGNRVRASGSFLCEDSTKFRVTKLEATAGKSK